MKNDYPFKPVAFPQVKLRDDFWLPRVETGRTVTLPFAFNKCEETGRIENFEAAAGIPDKEFKGRKYDDSDVFKIIEGAAYYLITTPDPELCTYLDVLIEKIAAAQEDDGYLFTCRTCHPDGSGDKDTPINPERWGHLRDDHELYCLGHLYEAAIAHYQATDKKTLLNIAIKNADLVCETFGEGGMEGVPGHQEIEIGLAKLYRLTGEEKYLQVARLFLERRGQHRHVTPPGIDHMKEDFIEYNQDHKPVLEQEEAVGHGVRALYMYAAMVDIAALTGDKHFEQASKTIWQSIVDKKLYITGGVGSRHNGEEFGADYELPNRTAYNETCAAIANIFFNHRLFLLSGDSRYIDVLERTLYNGFLAGYSLDGEAFFYPNPLESDGVWPFNGGKSATRRPWFNTSCCPSNVLRFLPSIPGYIYATRDDALYVNLYIGNDASLQVDGVNVAVELRSNYPWDGEVSLSISPKVSKTFKLKLRVPDWVEGAVATGELYQFSNAQNRSAEIALKINDKETLVSVKNGYITVEREWREGDRIFLSLPMNTELVKAHPQVEDNRNRLAIQRGPQVFCVEEADNPGLVAKRTVNEYSGFGCETFESLLGKNGIALIAEQFKAIPYWAWSNRGEGQMAVWLNKTRQ